MSTSGCWESIVRSQLLPTRADAVTKMKRAGGACASARATSTDGASSLTSAARPLEPAALLESASVSHDDSGGRCSDLVSPRAEASSRAAVASAAALLKTQGAPPPSLQQFDELRMREAQQPSRPPGSEAHPLPPQRPHDSWQHTL